MSPSPVCPKIFYFVIQVLVLFRVMNHERKNKIAAVLLGIAAWSFVGILALLPVHAFISTWGGTEIGPLVVWKGWKEILLTALLPVVAVYCALRPDIARLLWGRWFNKLITLFIVLHTLFAVGSEASFYAMAAGMAMNLGFFAMFLLAQMIMAADHPLAAWLQTRAATILLAIATGLSVLGAVQVYFLPADFLAQFGYSKDATIAPYILVDENPDALRAFATLRGPNELGSYLILPLMLALALMMAKRRTVLAGLTIVCGVIGMVLSSSRSAWLGLLAAIGALLAVGLPRPQLIRWVKRGALPVVAAAILFVWLATTIPVLRMAVFHSSPGDPTLFEGSTQIHWQATVQGAADIAQNPLGRGVGTAGPASYYNDNAPPRIAENYFVQIGQETGWMGLALFVAIHILVAYHLWNRRSQLWPRVLLASFAGLTVVNMFLHTWSDEPTAMTWWALAGLFIVSKQGNQS